MVKKPQNRSINSTAKMNTRQKNYVDDSIVEMTDQAILDGASHEEIGELQQQIKNGSYRQGDWERKVASWYD